MKIVIAIVTAAAVALSAGAANAAPKRDGAHAKAKTHHPRARIVVRPRYPYRTTHSLYPPPYDVEYPGPNAHRECSGGFATEYRASGPVIVPRLNCWWAQGRYPGP